MLSVFSQFKTIPKSSVLFSDRWGEKSSMRTSFYLNALITKIFGLILCFVNFSWVVFANAWSVKLISFIFNCCISSFWNYLFCFTVGVKGEWEKWRSCFTEVWGVSSRGSGLSTSDVRFMSLFEGSCRILGWNSELALIYGWAEVQMCHRQWKTSMRRSFLKVEQCFLYALELS